MLCLPLVTEERLCKYSPSFMAVKTEKVKIKQDSLDK